jgi:putative aldouronate transport system substrate-binding protein
MVAAEGSGQQDVNEAVNQLAQDKVNMKVNMIPMTFGTYISQMSMMLASGEALDLFPSFSNNFATYIESQYIVNCADYLDYAGDILRVMGEDAKSGYIGDFLVGFSQMKERAYPAGLVVRKDIFDDLGYKVSDFKVNTSDYASFQAITDLFQTVKEAHPDMTMLDGTSILGLQVLSYVDNLGDNFGVLENYGQTTTITNWYESEQYRTFCEIGRDWFQKDTARLTSQSIPIPVRSR